MSATEFTGRPTAAEFDLLRIRIERESSCGERAASTLRDPARLVRSLRAMGRRCAAPAGVLAVDGVDVKRRAVRRLGISRSATVLIVTLGAGALSHGADVQAEPAEALHAAPPAAPQMMQSSIEASVARLSRPPSPPRIFLAEASPTPPANPLALTQAGLGPMPLDSDPAAQAAWRARSYDATLRALGNLAQMNVSNVEKAKQRLDALKVTDPNDPHRLEALRMLDQATGVKSLTELIVQSFSSARDAHAQAEAVRLAVVAGTRPAADLVAARARASQAEHMAQTAAQALADKINVQLEGVVRTAASLKSATAIPQVAQIGDDLGKVIAVQERAKLESLAYSEVRDEVEAGRRPASDLEHASDTLRVAQQAMYDELDAMRTKTAASNARLRQDSAKRIQEREAQVQAMEARLPTLQGEARIDAEERLGMMREILADTKKSDASLASMSLRTQASTPHPELPILPARP